MCEPLKRIHGRTQSTQCLIRLRFFFFFVFFQCRSGGYFCSCIFHTGYRVFLSNGARNDYAIRGAAVVIKHKFSSVNNLIRTVRRRTIGRTCSANFFTDNQWRGPLKLSIVPMVKVRGARHCPVTLSTTPPGSSASRCVFAIYLANRLPHVA